MSNEENVAKYIIRQTPMGHLDESLTNLKSLVGEQPMDTPAIKGEIQAYQEDHLAHLSSDKGELVMSSLTKDSENYYHDQPKGIKFQFDADKLEAINIEESKVDDALLSAIEGELKKYCDKYYKPGVTQTNVYFDAATQKYVILISAHNFNKKSFWTGEWNSTWEVQGSDVKGKIMANTYYYESGNVQFNLKNDFSEKIEVGGPADTAASIFKAVEKVENAVHADLEKIFEDFSDNYIKPLRRNLPVTKSKMNWSMPQLKFD